MWLLVGGRGRGDRYFRGGQNISLGVARNCAQVWFKRGRWTVDDEASYISQTRRCAKIFYIASHAILSSKLFVVYLIFSLCFGRQNDVTEGKDGEVYARTFMYSEHAIT